MGDTATRDQPKQDGDTSSSSDSLGERRKPTLIDVLLLAIVLGALIGVTVIAIEHYPTSADAASILGIVVPAFATIGAAVFGVRVAYTAGKEKGQVQGEQGKTDAVRAATQQTAANLLPKVHSAIDAMGRMRDAVQTAGTSLGGERSLLFASIAERDVDQPQRFRLAEPEMPVSLDPDTILTAHGELEALRGALETLSQNGSAPVG